MYINSKAIRQLAAAKIIHKSPALSRKINRRRFRANLGCSSHVCTYVWNRIVAKGILPQGFLPTHLLWTLVFLKLYCCETILASLCGCDEKTLRKWVWKGVELIGELNLVSLKSQHFRQFLWHFVASARHHTDPKPSIHYVDQVEEPVHGREWQYLSCYTRWH